MSSLIDFFNNHQTENKGLLQKNNIIKRNIIAYMAVNGESTLAELTKELRISVPTITKLVQELCDEGIVTDLGKVETPGGRRPNVFGLTNTAIYFAGINVGRDRMTFVITDLQNNIIKEVEDSTFELSDRTQCLDKICDNIEHFINTCGIDKSHILGIGVCIVGRVNTQQGRSYKYFTSVESSLSEIIEQRVGIRVLVENDTRSRCYAEYTCGRSKDESNVLYLHLGLGVAIGIVVNGKLFYGKNGFAGEFGHIPFFDNEKICFCGKKGCLEAYASATGVARTAKEIISSTTKDTVLRNLDIDAITSKDVYDAAEQGDEVAKEIFDFTGTILGQQLADFIAFSAPEAIVMFGGLTKSGHWILDPVVKAMNDNVLPLWRNKVDVLFSDLKEADAAVLGASALAWGE